ncbi:hypothetical protein ACJQWK_04616 [Exserohilum turcicum]
MRRYFRTGNRNPLMAACQMPLAAAATRDQDRPDQDDPPYAGLEVTKLLRLLLRFMWQTQWAISRLPPCSLDAATRVGHGLLAWTMEKRGLLCIPPCNTLQHATNLYFWDIGAKGNMILSLWS